MCNPWMTGLFFLAVASKGRCPVEHRSEPLRPVRAYIHPSAPEAQGLSPAYWGLKSSLWSLKSVFKAWNYLSSHKSALQKQKSAFSNLKSALSGSYSTWHRPSALWGRCPSLTTFCDYWIFSNYPEYFLSCNIFVFVKDFPTLCKFLFQSFKMK